MQLLLIKKANNMINLKSFFYLRKKFNKLFDFVFKSKSYRRIILVTFDLFIILFSFIFSFIIRYDNEFINYIKPFIWILPIQIILSIPIYLFTGQYSSLSNFVELKILFKILQRNIVINLIAYCIGIILKFTLPTFSIWFLICVITSTLSLLVRNLIKKLLNYYTFSKFQKESKIHVAIYGAGYFGANLATSLNLNPKYKIVYFLDDNRDLWDRYISGVIIRSPNSEEIYKEIDQVLLCVENINKKKRGDIVSKFKKVGIPVLVIPSVENFVSGKTKFDDLNVININQLLGRDTINQDNKDLYTLIKGKNIFVSGAGGSIGSELCIQILRYAPARLILFERSEINLYTINNKILNSKIPEIEILPILGCATDKKLIEKIFNEHNIDMVFHAAAYKHVPIVENNPMQGIINNVISTKVLCEVSFASSVEKFCLISTDKAVRPSNIMGATKRLAELIVQYYSHKSLDENNRNNALYAKTSFFMVRFGNVLNSSGSVVPFFKKQIQEGGPITITHKKVTRYFMTISEAAQLVLNSAFFAKGEEVFLLDMGSPILIKELAIQMIKLSGLSVKDVENPNGDIEIIYTGLRPGEKLFEELLIDAEAIPTVNKKIFKATEKSAFIGISEYKLEKLIDYSKNYEYESSLELLKELVPEWISN